MKQIYNHPFKRGALGFDDFNYNLHNPYVMIETSQQKTGQDEKVERLTLAKLELLGSDDGDTLQTVLPTAHQQSNELKVTTSSADDQSSSDDSADNFKTVPGIMTEDQEFPNSIETDQHPFKFKE